MCDCAGTVREGGFEWRGTTDEDAYANVPGGFLGVSYMPWNHKVYVIYQATEPDAPIVPMGDEVEIAYFADEDQAHGIERGERLAEKWWAENGAKM